MERWWVDPDQAATVLTFVDDSDVAQGVSTAFLGYHGLAEGVLRPLAQQTLVDGAVISEALQDVDLEPVAKALGEATRPVLGSESDAYGQLLAKQFHDDAVESTTRFVTNLVSTGMSWPTAVERAASVHGVPVQRLGKAGAQLRAPVVAKASAFDVADRALMEFAAHVGIREDTRDVVSKMEREREFREEDVNRDSRGRFADKPSTGAGRLSQVRSQVSDDDLQRRAERQARRDKRAKRRARQSKQLQQMREQKQRNASLSQLKRVSEDKPDVRAAAEQVQVDAKARVQAEIKAKTQEDVRSKVKADVRAYVEQARKRAVAEAVEDFKAKRNSPPAPVNSSDLMSIPSDIERGPNGYPGVVMRGPEEYSFFLMNINLMPEVVNAQGFNWKRLKEAGAVYGTQALDRAGLQLEVDQISEQFNGDESMDDFAVLAFDGSLAFTKDFTAGDNMELADAGVYSVRHSDDSNPGDTLDLKLSARQSPGSSVRFPVDLPYVLASLDNDKDFEMRFSKQWNEAEVNRDRLGRFSDKPGGGGVGRASELVAGQAGNQLSREDRAARRERRERRRKRQAKQLAAMQRQKEARRPAQEQQTQQAQSESMERVRFDRADVQRQIRAQAQEEARAKIKQDVQAKVRSDVQVYVKEALARRLAEAETFKAKNVDNNDLKFTQAVVFDPDEDRGLLTGLFGYDPMNKKYDESLVDNDPDFRGDALNYGKSPVPASDAGSFLNVKMIKEQERGNRRYVSDDPEPVTENGNPIVTTRDNALGIAMDAANDKNRETPSSVERYVGFAQRRITAPGAPEGFEPVVMSVPIEETDIVVMGSDADWAKVRSGGNVTLQPIAGFDQEPDDPGLGTFDHLFGFIGEDEEWQRQMQSPRRSDFYVRAFRIKT